ncbi:MAG: hypothetical protein HND58_10765 [Planctomycetota bacterium]|nr:MAG: hypothetical protein HND58_10765 [Planctomycetota bacterium]
MCGASIGKADVLAALSDLPSAGRLLDPLERPLGEGFDLMKHLEDIERHYLGRGIEEAGGVKTKAAELLGLASYQTLDSKMKRLGVEWKKGRAG